MFLTSKLPRPAVTGALAVAVLLVTGVVSAPAASAAPAKPAIREAGTASAIPGSYIVKLKDTASVRKQGLAGTARSMSVGHHGKVGQVYDRVLHGFATSMTAAEATQLAADPDVDYIVADQRLVTSDAVPAKGVKPAAAQTPVSWSLDRIDQHALPLDNHYSYDSTAGQNVHAYVLGTGIDTTHPDFGGRAVNGANFIPDGMGNTDCHGAGTRVAGAVGGTQYGVAKKVSLVGVRIADCRNVTTLSATLSGFEWIVGNAVLPAVIIYNVLDYCFDDRTGQPAPCLPDTANMLINAQETAFASGIVVVDAAGDASQDTCSKATGAAPDTIYVGSTNINDALAASSNFGPCVTMYAPGEGITTDDPSGGSGTYNDSGFAASYVAGALALFMGTPEFAGATPGVIRDELVKKRSTNGVITGLDGTSSNRLLFTGPPGLFTTGSPTGMAPAPSGKLQLFGVNKAGFMFHREQTAPGSAGWTDWTRSQSRDWLSVAIGANADGRMEMAGVTAVGDIWPRAQAAVNTDTWFNWSSISHPVNPSPLARVAMAYNHSNRLEMFATNQQGIAYYRSQTSPGATTWTSWTQFSTTGKLRAISTVSNADGRIEVIGVDDAGQVWRAAQKSATDNNWSAFTKLDGFAMATVSAALNSNGTLEMIGVDTGGGAWRRTQTSAGAAIWTDWASLPTKTLADVATSTNTNGRVQIVGVDNVGNIWQSVQSAANSTSYSGWTSVDGQLRP